MRLNLGCGGDIRSKYVNVDFREVPGVDRVVDLANFPWPFDDDSAEEILMLDFLEHFPYAQTHRILLECHRVLRSGGDVVIQVPDAEHLTAALAQRGRYLCNRCGTSMYVPERDDGDGSGYPARNHPRCPKCGSDSDEISEAAMRRLYGGQDYPGNFHQCCFTKRSLAAKAASSGFALIADEEFETQQFPNWNFKLRFRKADLWGVSDE